MIGRLGDPYAFDVVARRMPGLSTDGIDSVRATLAGQFAAIAGSP
jgi:hypothetical protein